MSSSKILEKWTRCTRRLPCPVCGKPDWCLIARDGTAVICARTMSDHPAGTNGAGWLHVLSRRVEPPVVVPPVRARMSDRQWSALAARFIKSLPDQDDLHRALGVSPESLGKLLTGWDELRRVYTFPMRDGSMTVIGIRTRARDSRKAAIPGSRNGLFIPSGEQPGDELWVCEGPTDCAALLTLGLYAVGRPNNTGGLPLLMEYLGNHREIRSMVIVADRDANPAAEAVTLESARMLAQEARLLRVRSKIIRPQLGYKDVREWINRRSITAAAIRCIAGDAKWI